MVPEGVLDRLNQHLNPTDYTMKFPKLIINCKVLLFVTLAAKAASFTVPGTSNPWLAGMPNGSTAGCSGIDAVPAESPVPVTGVTVHAGWMLSFTATGSVGYQGGVSDPADGDTNLFIWRHCGSENGIANVFAPADALLGVFLDDTQPDSSAAPSPFSASITNAIFTPDLKQPFFIGDGLTDTGSGSVQQFIVPAGATRLFLGTMDGEGWYNNVGSFSVTVKAAPLLSIQPTGGRQVQLTWPTNAVRYSLEYATDPATSGWTTVTNNPEVMTGQFVLPIDISVSQRFFRLNIPQ